VVNEGIVDVRVVATVELDEVGGDVVALDYGGEGLAEQTADDTEGEPVVGTEDAVDGVLSRNSPHLVVFHSVLRSIGGGSSLELALFFLENCLEDVIASNIVWILLPPKDNV
jgi:hypothetical protein